MHRALCVLASVAAVVVLLQLRRAEPATSDAPSPTGAPGLTNASAPRSTPPRDALRGLVPGQVPPGVRQSFSVEYHTAQLAPLVPGQRLSGSTDLLATLTLTGLTPERSGQRAARLALTEVHEFALRVRSESPTEKAAGADAAQAKPVALPTVAHPTGAHPAGAHPAGAHPAGAHPAVDLPTVDLSAGAHPAVDLPAGAHPAGSHPAVDLPTVDLATGRAALLAPVAVVTWDAAGRPESLAFSPGASPLFTGLVQGLVLDSQLATPPEGARAWQTTEVGVHGEYDGAYTRASARELARRHTAYRRLRAFPDGVPGGRPSEVEGDTRARLDARGGVEELVRNEHIAAGAGDRRLTVTSRLIMRRLSEERVEVATAALPPGFVRQSAQVMSAGDAARLRALEARVAGLSMAELTTAVVLAGDGPSAANGELLWRAVGLLKLHPELAQELAALALAHTTSAAGRALALDLLVSAGHPEAQAALREVIAGRVGQPDYASCLARLALVQTPAAATVEVALAALDGAEGNTAALAVGALADWTRQQGDAETSAALVTRLGERLADAESDEDRVSALRALGNAGGAGVLALAEGYVSDESAPLRAAAADALRDVSGEAALAALGKLLADPDPEVQRSALSALMKRPLEDDEQERLAAQLSAGLASGLISPELHARLLVFAERQLADPALAASLAAAIRAASQDAGIRTAAATLEAASAGHTL